MRTMIGAFASVIACGLTLSLVACGDKDDDTAEEVEEVVEESEEAEDSGDSEEEEEASEE